MEELNKSFISVLDLAKFNACALKVLNKEAPIKKKLITVNEARFMMRKLKKAIMVRSRLRNTFLKHPTNENKKSYGKQRKFCVSLLRKQKKKTTLKHLILKISMITNLLENCETITF